MCPPNTEEELGQLCQVPLGPPLPTASLLPQQRGRSTCTPSTRRACPALLLSSGLLRACPSLCQVMLGWGVPWALQWSSKGVPGVSDSSAVWSESLIWGGSARHPTLA